MYGSKDGCLLYPAKAERKVIYVALVGNIIRGDDTYYTSGNLLDCVNLLDYFSDDLDNYE